MMHGSTNLEKFPILNLQNQAMQLKRIKHMKGMQQKQIK